LLTVLVFSACKVDKSFPSPLEGVTVANQTFEATETERTIDVGKRMEGVAIMATDMETNEPPTWLAGKIENTKLTLKLKENITIKNRKARIHMYYDGGRSDIDNADLAVDFYVEQKRNRAFDGFDVEEIKMNFLQSDSTVSTSASLKGVKATISDLDGETVTWCTVRALDNALFVKVTENKNKGERQAVVRLAATSQNATEEDSVVAKKLFLVSQRQNPVLDSLTIPEVSMPYEDSRKVIKTNRTLRNIKAVVNDNQTQTKASWCSVTIAGDSIAVHANILKSKIDRTATVTLYLPNNGEVIDSTTIQTTFTIKQLHNDVFDDLKLKNVSVSHLTTTDTILVGHRISGFKCKHTDVKTGKAATWMYVAVGDTLIVVKPQKNMSNSDRAADITIYQSNNGDVVDTTTVSTTFRFIQRHNRAIDTLDIKNDTIAYSQTLDTLKLGSDLTGFKCELVDTKTKVGPEWLTAKVISDGIVFTSKENLELSDRSATVTLYQPNGNVIDDNTIQKKFLFVQESKKTLTVEKESYQTDYTDHTIEVIVTSNVKYQVDHFNYNWIQDCQMTPIDDNHEKLTIQLTENKTTSNRNALLTLSSGSLKAKFRIEQLTNPAIRILDGKTKRLIFDKSGGELALLVTTLTPEFKVSNKKSWIRVGQKQLVSDTTSRFDLNIATFYGQGPLRYDTITVKNYAEEEELVIEQHKFLYFENSKIEIEIGKQHEMKFYNFSGKSVTWKSKNANIATVNQNGIVTALQSGKVGIEMSIGQFYNVENYNDVCEVTIYTPADKLELSRGNGDYIRNADYVTANCPVIIKNNYNGPITINSVTLKNGNDTFSYTSPSKNVALGLGQSKQFDLTPINNLLKPVIVIEMTCDGKTYTKTENF
jgi:hypothetical protein